MNILQKLRKPFIKQISNKEIIERIHHEFFTEVDALLAEAKIELSTEINKKEQKAIDTATKLHQLGFKEAKPVLDGFEVERSITNKKYKNQMNEKLAKAIEYFSMKYPQYKFITEQSVRRIAKKYNLVFTQSNKYKGDIPQKNIDEMLNFSIKKDDICYQETMCNWDSFGARMVNNVMRYLTYDEYSMELDKKLEKVRQESGIGPSSYNYLISPARFASSASPREVIVEKSPIMIVAPAKDITLDRNEMIVDNEVVQKEIPDPVVLQPVYYQNAIYYLIMTAWGEEASDPDVFNEKLN